MQKVEKIQIKKQLKCKIIDKKILVEEEYYRKLVNKNLSKNNYQRYPSTESKKLLWFSVYCTCEWRAAFCHLAVGAINL